MWIWQKEDWPNFSIDATSYEEQLATILEQAGAIGGKLDGLPQNERTANVIDSIVLEAVKTSEIEGEMVSREDVLSSVRNHLGLNRFHAQLVDRRAAGVVAMSVTSRETYLEPLTKTMLFRWHELLFSNDKYLNTGCWRSSSEPMQIVSGRMFTEVVHYEAPPSDRVPAEMERFVSWYTDWTNEPRRLFPIFAALGHLYFESIHPFEDGNGRVGRALAEKTLSLGWRRPAIMSLSSTIEKDRKKYYSALQSGRNDIYQWVSYFLNVVIEAQHSALAQIQWTIKKTHFLDGNKGKMSGRQLKTINKMLDAGPAGFEGGMTARKYGSINRVSKATATRDLSDLYKKGLVSRTERGRNVAYYLKLE